MLAGAPILSGSSVTRLQCGYHQRVAAPNPDRLRRQIAFVVEADKLKSVLRRTPIADNSRLENSAEH
jgi:hypothetical protein